MSHVYLKPLVPTRVIYVFATIGVFLFVIAFIWFMFYAVITPLSSAITPLANSFHNDSWTLSTPLTQVESFMGYFWQFLLMFGVVGLALWVWMESQRRGQPY